jgi:hypothetical protein
MAAPAPTALPGEIHYRELKGGRAPSTCRIDQLSGNISAIRDTVEE